jgi:hypothetical protein
MDKTGLPLILRYVQERSEGEQAAVGSSFYYDEDSAVNLFNSDGSPVAARCMADLLTETRVAREQEDTPSYLMGTFTKTYVDREADDDDLADSALVSTFTKTEAIREIGRLRLSFSAPRDAYQDQGFARSG